MFGRQGHICLQQIPWAQSGSSGKSDDFLPALTLPTLAVKENEGGITHHGKGTLETRQINVAMQPQQSPANNQPVSDLLHVR